MIIAAYSRNTDRAARAYIAKKTAEKRALADTNMPGIAEPEPEVHHEPEQVETANPTCDIAIEAVKQFDDQGAISDDLKAERIPVAQIIKAVCVGTDVTPRDVLGKDRSHRILAVRDKAICIVALARPTLSIPQIGKEFGGRDHSSILHCLKKHGIIRERAYKPKKLTEEDIAKIHELRDQGMGRDRIASTMQIPTSRLDRILSDNGKKPVKSRVVELFELGKDTYEIAQIMGLTEAEVANRLWSSRNVRNQNRQRKQAA